MAKVSVDGEGKAKGAPDIALIQVTVQNEANDQATCRQENNACSEAVVATLKKVVDENDVYVTPARVQPDWDYGKRKRRQNGFKGYNLITAKVRNLESAQDLLTEINNLNVEKIQVSSFSFDIDDKKELENEARRSAFAHAKAKAETYAQETDLPMSGVVSIEENLHYGGGAGRHPSGKFAASRMECAMDAGPGGGGEEMLEMGDIEVTVNIAACFKLGED